jgi:hypothetical protein
VPIVPAGVVHQFEGIKSGVALQTIEAAMRIPFRDGESGFEVIA